MSDEWVDTNNVLEDAAPAIALTKVLNGDEYTKTHYVYRVVEREVSINERAVYGEGTNIEIVDVDID